MPNHNLVTEEPISSSGGDITVFSLQNWINGKFGMQDLEVALAKLASSSNIQFALEIGKPTDAHKSGELPAQSFSEKKKAVAGYVKKAKSFLKSESQSDWIMDENSRQALIRKIGHPPESVTPIYFITSESEALKTIVYVGKTAALTGRFGGGHLALSKLHDPAYEGTAKRVYMASILARIEESEWINLEMIQPIGRATFYLSEVELNLIYRLKPALNTVGIDTLDAEGVHLIGIRDTHQIVPPSDWVWVTSKPLDR
jgi:hypothetical protein